MQSLLAQPAPEVLVAEAVRFSVRGEMHAAVKAAKGALNHPDGLKGADVDKLAAVLLLGSEVETALELYNGMLAKTPEQIDALRGRAMALRFKGDVAAAEDAFDTLLARFPRDYEAQILRSSLRRQTEHRNHVEELERLIDGEITDWREITAFAFALSKELDDLGRFEAAWFHLSNGAKIRRRHLVYDVAQDQAMMAAIATAFDGQALRGRAEDQPSGPVPLFIVGLPRSGSTLVERILSSHPAIGSIGESTVFPNVISELLGRRGNSERLATPALSLEIDPAEIAQTYLDRVGARDMSGAFFIDKLPVNFLNIGIIRRSLPMARIIDVRRKPLAACFAMFRQLFSDAYPFSYDITECAKYYASYVKLLEHWNTVAPQTVLNISYESLIDDPRTETERMLTYLGLPWSDQCLRYASNPVPSLTASTSQVRQEIYRSGVDSWRPYRNYLDAAAETLRDHQVTVDERS